jgi:2-polyprenyl-3-methyl-5-hydroxy-6-metoxy-1,4-benzoquinol methylase
MKGAATMNPYEKEFAQLYDIIVHGKEGVEAGEEELHFIEWIFKEVCPREVNEVLDVGCGNGRFLLPLARKGYNVTGLDISKDMLEECSIRLEKENLRADLITKDLKTIDFDSEYDALLCMDSVICYFLESEEIITVLEKFRQVLRPQGMLILENWNILAEWELFGKTHSFSHCGDTLKVEWQEHNWYDTFSSIFHGEITGTITERGQSHAFRHEEVLRAMTVGEMKMYLKEAEFSQMVSYPSYDLSKTADVNGDIMLFVAISPR